MNAQKITISDLPELTGTVEDEYMLPIDDGEITKKVTVAHFEEAASATARQYAEAAADSATAAAGSAHDAELIATEIAGDIAAATQAANDARGAATRAAGSADAAAAADVQAQRAASAASTSANTAAASASEASGYKTDAQAAADRAASWADYPGQTGNGDATHNAHFYADQAASAIVGVASWNGRSGNVMPEDDDYSLNMLGDVDLRGQGDKKALVYNAQTSKWEPSDYKMNNDGSNASNHVVFGNALTVGTRDGNATVNSFVNGNACSVRAEGGHAEGDHSSAGALYSHAEGSYSKTYGDYSHAEGQSIANGNTSHSEGYKTTAHGFSSHSEGGADSQYDPPVVSAGVFISGTLAYGDTELHLWTADRTKMENFFHNTISFEVNGDSGRGYVEKEEYDETNQRYTYNVLLNSAWNGSSHTDEELSEVDYNFMNLSIAHGDFSHMEGRNNRNVGIASHVEGSRNYAYGDYSHAEGEQTTSDHTGSHAEGFKTKTGADYQHVCGEYNIGRTTTIMEVGNGTAENARSNAFEVYADGSISTDNGITKVKLQDLPSAEGGEEYTFHIVNTKASTAVAWCNKVARFYPRTNTATVNNPFSFDVLVAIGDHIKNISNTSYVPSPSSITLYDAATAKQTIASTGFGCTTAVVDTLDEQNRKKYYIRYRIGIRADFITTDAIANNINAVKNSASPGFAAVYDANTFNVTGTIKGQGVVEQIPGFPFAFNTSPTFDHITQHVGDFFFPTGGARWYIDLEVNPGTAYMAICYLENTTTGAYFNHSICYAGVGVPTIAAPTVAPAPVAGKVISFIGTTWTPFIAGVAGVVTNGVVTTKPRLRMAGYNSSDTPTAGLGMHLRLFRIY